MKRQNYRWLAVMLAAGMAFAGCEKGNANSTGSGTSSSGGNEVKAVQVQYTPVSDFKYDLTKDGKGIMIYDYTGKGGKVVIPPTIEDFPVVEIGKNAFSGGYGLYPPNNCDKITALVLHEI